MRVHEVTCICSVEQPSAQHYALGAIWICESCSQTWKCASRAASTRVSAGKMVGGILVGGTRRQADIHKWVRVGGDVAVAAARAAARLHADDEYEQDMAALKAAMRAGTVAQGTSVREYREMRVASAQARVRAAQRQPSSVGYAVGTGLMVALGLMSASSRNDRISSRLVTISANSQN